MFLTVEAACVTLVTSALNARVTKKTVRQSHTLSTARTLTVKCAAIEENVFVANVFAGADLHNHSHL